MRAESTLRSTATILIVDDNEFMRALLHGILHNHRYKVVGEADCGSKAVAAVERFKPDIVCMDVWMPGKSGIQALREIKSRHPEVRIVIVSADASAENIYEAVGSGADGIIVKPFRASKVIETIHRVDVRRSNALVPLLASGT